MEPGTMNESEKIDHANTLMRSSVRAHNLDLMKVACNEGADMDGLGYDGVPHLTWLIKHGHSKEALFLIEKGAKTDLKDTYGSPLLLEASWKKLDDVCVALIEKNADIHVKYNGSDLLHIAADHFLEKTCLKLMDKGLVDVFHSEKNGNPNTLMAGAVQGSMFELVLRLFDMGVSSGFEGWGSLLHMAAARDQEVLCEQLILRRLSLEVHDQDGCTPLNLARDETARILLYYGADPTNGDQQTHLPIHSMEAHQRNLRRQEITRELFLEDGKFTPAMRDAIGLGTFPDITAPLLKSGKAEDIALLKDLYTLLPKVWKHRYSSLPIDIRKLEGDIEPALGLDSEKERS